ncbi:MAG: DEAD/DEAH box helicase [Chitinophagaceae bacterium]|nr:DEAD/DEAH box helicase [Chitinophagaceae bacterium]
MTFQDFNFDPRLQESIEAMGYTAATPVQEKVIPVILEGRDLIASAQTGTGKTAAFLLPIIHKLLTEPRDHHSVNCLVIVPTRELAVQISQALEGMSYFTDIGGIPVYGGGDGDLFTQEKKALSSGADIVICTPGRMIAHLNMGYVKLQGLQYLVLDEADRMLDMGFHGDILRIIGYLPKQRQNLLFSATMPPKIRELARKILVDPAEVSIAISKPPEKIKQGAFVVYDEQKIKLVSTLLRTSPFRLAIVFCSSKDSVKRLTFELKRNHLKVAEIHSDLEQPEREQVLLDYRNEKIRILVATDILSRGIDIDIIDLVINYDVPHDGEDYVHRVGRTARAERVGTALTLVNPRDQRKFAHIEKLLEKEVPKLPLPAELGEGPEWKPFERREGGGHGRGGGGAGKKGGKKPFRGGPGGGKPRPAGGDGQKHGKPQNRPPRPQGPRPDAGAGV